MEIFCTRPGCKRPQNFFADLDDETNLKTVQQKFCVTCGMPLLLLGRYLPLKLLARGGFGAAFLARDRYTPGMRKCVVKQLQPTTTNPQQLEVAKNLFYREGEVLEELGSHPLIPDLLAFFELPVAGKQPGEQDNFFYLAQEFIDGQTLEEELLEKGAFSAADVLEVLQEILPILKFVHENGSVHRDIKLSNIMRQKPKNPGGKGKLFLLDFGAVKQVANVAAATAAKATGIYTPFFAPPEQVHGEQVFPSTDLYSLAVTCIALLTGKGPADLYDPYSNHWQWRSHLGANPVPDSLAQVLDRMLLPAPNQRFQSADEALSALTPQPVTPTKPPPLPPRSTPPPVSSPQAVVATPPLPPPAQAQSSILPFITSSALTGFEGGLLAIALLSLSSFLGTVYIGAGVWLFLLAGLIFVQVQHVLKRPQLLVISVVTALLVFLFPILRGGQAPLNVLLLAVLIGLAAVGLGIIFQLVYGTLSRWL
ncbi:MAG: serine/threonine protein kinase [Aphanocapsa sp. GSE-SYN-MK-11-07L]|jgi:serine/threonine-protein kinase|nr:serine/threonine protein kinase [Aphanocapsa sp. GSE-SYN-MK-11-07L]